MDVDKAVTRSQSYDFGIYKLQRQRCSRLERFMKIAEYILVFKTHQATRSVANFYNTSAVKTYAMSSLVRFGDKFFPLGTLKKTALA
jgi:hypothetical protein